MYCELSLWHAVVRWYKGLSYKSPAELSTALWYYFLNSKFGPCPPSFLNPFLVPDEIWSLLAYIEWGSEIPTSLDFEWSKRGWVANGPDLNGIWNLEAQLFEIWTNGCHFFKTIWNLDKNVRILNGWTIAIARALPQPFEIRPSKTPDFKWSDLRFPLYYCSKHTLCSPEEVHGSKQIGQVVPSSSSSSSLATAPATPFFASSLLSLATLLSSSMAESKIQGGTEI